MKLPARAAALACALLAVVLSVLAPVATAQQGYQPGQSWPRVQFPDGSGSIAVPPGWRLNSAQQASAELQGPRGEAVAAGITMEVGPGQFSQPGVLAGPYLLPPDAFAWVSEVIARRGGHSAQTRVVEVQPTASLTQNGRTAYLLADQMNRGRHYRSFALVNTAALGNGYWQYYMTLLTTPAEVFPLALPLMTEIWQSWSISQGEMTRRTAQAMLTMQETNRIMQSTAEGRRTTQWHQYVTGMTLQGRWVLEDTTTGQRFEVTSEQMNTLLQQHPGRYRVVSASELR